MKLNEYSPADLSAGAQTSFKEIRLAITAASEIRTFFDEYKMQDSHDNVDRIILCDADDTLVKPSGLSGSSVWFFEAASYLMHTKSITKPEAFRSLERLVNDFIGKASFELVENEWPSVIQHFYDHNFPVVVVTGRTAAVANATVEWLKKFNIPVSHDYFGEEQEVFLPLDKARHYQGTLHCGAHPKGEVVAHFMKQRHDLFPFKKRIDVFLIDDREHYLDQLSRGLESLANELQADIVYYRVHYIPELGYPDTYNLSEEEIGAIEQAYALYCSQK